MTLLRAGKGSPKYSLIRGTVTQAITTSTSTALNLTTATVDDESWHSASRITPGSEVTVVTIGINIRWQAHSTGYRQNWVGLNGTGAGFGNMRPQGIQAASSNDMELNWWTPPIRVATPGTDYYQSIAWHNKGINLNVYMGVQTWLSVISMEEA